MAAPVSGDRGRGAPQGLLPTAGTRAAREEAWGRLVGSTPGVRGGFAPRRERADRPPTCFAGSHRHRTIKVGRLDL